MRATIRRPLGVLVAAVAVFLIVGLSRLPYDPSPDDRPMVRLSWRAPGELIEECRRLSAEELEHLPIHMRREEVCEGRLLPYRLEVMLDGHSVMNQIVLPAGAREDRPLYVFEEQRVQSGEHRIEVRWNPESNASTEGMLTLHFDSVVTLNSREVLLITYDSALRRLRAGQPLSSGSNDSAIAETRSIRP